MIYILPYPETFTQDFLKDFDTEAEFAYLVDEPTKKIYQKDVTFDHASVLTRTDKPIIVVGAEVLKRIFRISGIMKLQGKYETLKSKELGAEVRVGFLKDPKMIILCPDEEAGIIKTLRALMQDTGEVARTDFHYPEHNFRHLSEVYDYLNSFAELVIDIETSSLNPIRGDILGIVISPNKEESFYYDWETVDKYLLEKLLKNKELIGHNIKFDWKYLIEKGMDLYDTVLHDTMILVSLSGTEKDRGLKPLSMRYTNFGFYDKNLQDEKKKICRVKKIKVGEFDYSMFPPSLLGKYACYDGVATYALWELFREHCKHPMYPYLMDATKEIGHMELLGAPIDKERLYATMEPLKEKIKELHTKMMKLVRKYRDGDFNFNSPKQLGELFFTDMGLDVVKRTDTGAPSTDAEVLGTLAEQGVELAVLLKEYRKLNKFVGTYLVNIAESIDKDGRVRTSFNLTGTTSGRLSSGKDTNAGDFAGGKSLNFQNIPSNDKMVKKLFKTARKDYVILNLDLKNAELWLVGFLADEPAIMQAFANGEDIHSSAAVMMFGLPCEPNQVKELYPEKRQHAKTVNFAILYQAGPGRIAEELGIDFMEAKNLINTWFKAYPNVKKWIEQNKAKIKETGWVETYFGRRRMVDDLNARNRWVAEHAVKSAINMLVQSPASDINLIGYCNGMKEIREFGYRFTPFALVHDSIVGECHKDDIFNVVATFSSHIKQVIPHWCPIGVDSEWGPSWGEVK